MVGGDECSSSIEKNTDTHGGREAERISNFDLQKRKLRAAKRKKRKKRCACRKVRQPLTKKKKGLIRRERKKRGINNFTLWSRRGAERHTSPTGHLLHLKSRRRSEKRKVLPEEGEEDMREMSDRRTLAINDCRGNRLSRKEQSMPVGRGEKGSET